MDVDSREEWLIRVEDTIVCGKIMGLHSDHCRVTLADASNPFAIAHLMHANGKTLDDIPTVCVNSFEMAETITTCIEKEVRDLLSHTQEKAIEIVLPARCTMPEILGDGFPYIRLRIFEDGIMNEIITHVARPLAMYVDAIQDMRFADCQSKTNDNTELCRELQVPDAIMVFFDAHRKPIVIDSSGRSDDDITGIIGKHEVCEHRHISKNTGTKRCFALSTQNTDAHCRCPADFN